MEIAEGGRQSYNENKDKVSDLTAALTGQNMTQKVGNSRLERGNI